jgi:hypothetical protein
VLLVAYFDLLIDARMLVGDFYAKKLEFVAKVSLGVGSIPLI